MVGNLDRSGLAGRGSRRRGCAKFFGLEFEHSAKGLVIGWSADPVEPNGHRRNMALPSSFVTTIVAQEKNKGQLG